MKKRKIRLSVLKSKKGFTLIELIAVVVLLAIVSAIGSLSISSIGGSVKTRQKNNLISSLKVQAKKYVNETGMKKVYVDTLIKEGYVQSDKIDNPDQIIVDPTDSKKTLNCYYFDFTSNEDGDVSVDANETTPGECNSDIFLDSILNIKYCDKDNCELKEYQNFYTSAGSIKWIRKETIKLKAITGDMSIIDQDLVDSTSIWTTPLAPDVNTKTSEYELAVPNGYLEAVYQVNATKDDKDYVATQLVKIDAVLPVITNVRVENADEWGQEKHIYADFEDSGSGLAGYIITNKKETPSESAAWQSISGKIFNLNTNSEANKIHRNGTYYIYVKDMAGNVTNSPAEITIDMIDTTAPECVHSGDNKEWTNVEVEITWGCKYDVLEGGFESPCTDESTQIRSYKDMITKKYTYTISDEAGNTRECKNQVADIYSDTKAPTCNVHLTGISGDNGWYKRNDVNVSLTKNDEGPSGIDSYGLTTSTAVIYNNQESGTQGNTSGIIWYGYVKDKAGNTGACNSTSFKVDKTAPTCSVTKSGTVGDNEWYKERNVTLSLIKNDTGGSGISGFGLTNSSATNYNSQENNTQGNTNGITWYGHVKDKAGNTGSCNSGSFKVDKTAPTCIVSLSGTSGDNGWYKEKDVTVSLTKNDTGGSGLKSFGLTNSSATNYNSQENNTQGNTNGITWYGHVKDKAGNTGSCNSGSFKVDKTAPIVSEFILERRSGYEYNSIYAHYSITGSDEHSGIKETCFTSNNDSSECIWKTASNNNYQYNPTFNQSEGSGETITRYAFVKDNAGNISSSVVNNYVLYEKCSITIDDGTGPWSECSATCGGGTRTRELNKKDKYLGTKCASETETESCNTNPCCTMEYRCTTDGKYQKRCGSSSNWIDDGTCTKSCSDYGSCSVSCGGGTKTRSCYYYKGSVQSNSFSESTSCNTHQCGHKICNTNTSILFGTSWNPSSPSNNVGGYWHQNNTFVCVDGSKTCSVYEGYHRKCVYSGCKGTDYDGSNYNYTNKTAWDLNNSLGCKFAAFWCTCP